MCQISYYTKEDIPHASQKLDNTTISESRRNDDAWRTESIGSKIDQGENEGGKCKGTETEGSRVGELAVGNGLVSTGLEFTTKGRKANRVPSVNMCERVSTVVVWLALLGREGIVIAIGRNMVVAADAVGSVHVLVADDIGVDVVLILSSRHR